MSELEQFSQWVSDMAHSKGIKLAFAAEKGDDLALHVCADFHPAAMTILSLEMAKVVIRQASKNLWREQENEKIFDKIFKDPA